MKKIPNAEHLALLPKKDYPVDIAIELLVSKYPKYNKEGLFDSPIFLENFVDRCRHILDNLPTDEELRRNIEMEFAFMANEIQKTNGIDLYEHIERVKNAVNQTVGDKKHDSCMFQRFQQESIQVQDLHDSELVVRYLNFLLESTKQGISQARFYIKSCVDLSQLSGGFHIFNKHIKHQLYSINHQDVLNLEDMNMYLGHESIDRYTQKVATQNNLSYVEATHMVGSEQMHLASLHAFINSVYESKIRPYIFSISVQERYELSLLLNDFRDILDPRQRIPDSFVTEYPLEQIERNDILFRGRNLH